MKQLSSFNTYSTNNDIDLHICNISKFKSTLIQLYIVLPLADEQTATQNAMLPFLLYRGSEEYPTNQDLTIKLNELYGASLSVSVLKRGENQLLRFSLELVNERYLPEDVDLFDQGLELLYQIIFNPLLENNSFLGKYVKQIKKYITEQIKGIVNDKYTYAVKRCFQEMCKDEPYGIYKLGNISSLENINGKKLYTHYLDLIKENPMSIFVVGNVEDDIIQEKINNKFNFKRDKKFDYNSTQVVDNVNKVREVVEKAKVQQGKLSLGFRTGTTRSDNLYYALLLYNGILGGFPHSKLFQNVREKSSLAYYANSQLESTKGLMLINSGIQIEKYNMVKEIILKQISDIANGQITDQEYEWTKKGLINHLQSTEDRITGLTGHFLLGLINNCPESIESMIENISRVTKKEIIEVANRIKLDTVYFLKDGRIESERNI